MQTRTKYILGSLAAGAILLGAAGAIAHKSGHHGWKRHHHGMMGFAGPHKRFCRHDGMEMADHLIVKIKHRVKPTESQQADFEELKTVIRQAAEKMQEACPPKRARADSNNSDAKPRRRNPIERLTRAETGLTASLEAVRMVKPVAEKFYATLSEEQKARLVKRKRHHWGWRKHHRGSWDEGPSRGSDDHSPKKGKEG